MLFVGSINPNQRTGACRTLFAATESAWLSAERVAFAGSSYLDCYFERAVALPRPCQYLHCRTSIAAEYHLASSARLIFSHLSVGYAIFQTPGGWLADKFGPGACYAGVLWWGIFTA